MDAAAIVRYNKMKKKAEATLQKIKEGKAKDALEMK